MTKDLYRVDIAGVTVFVHGEIAKNHLERVSHSMALMKLALHKIKRLDGEAGEVAKKGLDTTA